MLKLLLFIGALNPLVAVIQSQSSLLKQEIMTPFPSLSPDDGLVTRGVLQEVWHNINFVKTGLVSLRSDGRFPNAPDIVTVHEGFDVYDFDTKIYGQRLTAYLLVCVFLQITRTINTVTIAFTCQVAVQTKWESHSLLKALHQPTFDFHSQNQLDPLS